MDADRLIAHLLEDEQDWSPDPEHEGFLERHPEIQTGLPEPDEVEYDLFREDEDIDVRDHFGDPEDVRWVQDQLERGNQWAWFSAQVQAVWTDPSGEKFVGRDYLGGCSYRSREDFMAPGGYYEDMKKEAYEDLIRSIESSRNQDT